MLIDIDRLPEKGLKICRDFDFISSELIEESAVFLKPVHADVLIKKTGEEILIKGKITTCLSFICSRCLLPFEFPIDSSFDFVYVPEEIDVVKEQLDRDDVNKLFYNSRSIDLREEILEQLNLTFPIRPLCSEDCQGICPVCGKIIKSGECSCQRDEPDPRLEKLKTFLRNKI